MSVAHVHGGVTASGTHHAGAVGVRGSIRPLAVGQIVNLTVQRQLSEQLYLAQIATRPGLLVESGVSLTTGLPMRATVVAVGARLELRLIDSESQSTVLVSQSDPGGDGTDSTPSAAPQAAEAAAMLTRWIDAMSARYDLRLSEGSRSKLMAAMSTASDPDAMALAGMYLAKSGIPLTPPALDALYEAQQDDARRAQRLGSPVNLDPLLAVTVPPASADLKTLVDRMDASLNQTRTAATSPTAARESVAASAQSSSGAQTGPGGQASEQAARDRYALAQLLLNVPAGASASRHFGTFPILVSGQLLELQFVAFQHREVPTAPAAVKRLLMTLTTPSLGRVQVAAQAQAGRLSVSFVGESSQAAELLARHAPEVRELVSRLGWRIDSVVYGVGRPEGAAAQAMRQTLSDSTMDQLL
jgi:hypothetical protein